MKLRLLILLSILVSGVQSYAQEGIPVYFDYLSDNYYLVYPSMAGISEGGKIRGTARKQWFNVDEAPSLQTLNANFRVGSNNGVGAILFNDANGYHALTGVKLTFAHHLKLGGDDRYLNQISFGLSPTYLQSSLDESEFRDTNDPAIVGSKISNGFFNMDLGMSYSKMDFYAHFAVLNVLGTERNLYRFGRNDPDNLPLIDDARKYLASVGYIIDKGDWQLEPSILFQISEFKYQSESDVAAVSNSEKSLDINFKLYRELNFGRVWGGISYRTSFDGAQFQTESGFGEQQLQLITPIVGVNFNNFLVSYNYSYQMGDIRFDNGGFHQITLGYDFGQLSRRYDCYCPAAQ